MSRRRFRYDAESKSMVEVGQDWSDAPRGGSHISEGEIFDGLRATDGADISSRKKRREYMKANELTDPSDFKQHYMKKEEERRRVFSGRADRAQRKERIAHVMDQLSRGGRR